MWPTAWREPRGTFHPDAGGSHHDHVGRRLGSGCTTPGVRRRAYFLTAEPSGKSGGGRYDVRRSSPRKASARALELPVPRGEQETSVSTKLMRTTTAIQPTDEALRSGDVARAEAALIGEYTAPSSRFTLGMHQFGPADGWA